MQGDDSGAAKMQGDDGLETSNKRPKAEVSEAETVGDQGRGNIAGGNEEPETKRPKTNNEKARGEHPVTLIPQP
eukprot:8029190-Pyramimonas_sp.AAC.3